MNQRLTILQVIDIEQCLYRETKVWHSLSHKNVIPFLGLCHDVGPFPAMISYLCDNGHVNEYFAKDKKADPLEIVSFGYLSRDDIVGFMFISPDYWHCVGPPIFTFPECRSRRRQRSEDFSC
jgi:hypothetical protein